MPRITKHSTLASPATVRCARFVLALCVLCFALLAGRARASSESLSTNPSFYEGVEAYRAGDYPTARHKFLAALEDRFTDRAACLRNLGNVAFRERRPLEAAGWFTAAVREAPRDRDAWFNLEYVRREAGLEPADRGDLADTAVRLATMLRVDEAERVVLALLGALALALAWEALRGGLAAKATAWSLAGVLGLALIPYVVQLSRAGGDPCFVIQPEGAALNSEPRENAALIGRLAPAKVVERIDHLPGWVRVRSSNGELGWVREDAVLALDEGGDVRARAR
jgi:tetratricopeptide (TPR) repeat protein